MGYSSILLQRIQIACEVKLNLVEFERITLRGRADLTEI